MGISKKTLSIDGLPHALKLGMVNDWNLLLRGPHDDNQSKG